MSILNIEFKASVEAIGIYEEKLLSLNPKYIGLDHQIDTYFNTSVGRLKLREGNIENALIHYERKNIAGSKESKIILYKHQPDSTLKSILAKTIGVKVVVDKRRKIYFIENVKFHFDQVEGLGTFIDVEAIDESGAIGHEKLKQQCDHYFHFFELTEANVIDRSYSDLLMEKQ